MSVVVSSRLERRIFTTTDGRVLGTEVRIDGWYRPFAGERDEDEKPLVTYTETDVGTAAFHTLAEAQAWVEELRSAQQASKVAAWLARGGHIPFHRH